MRGAKEDPRAAAAAQRDIELALRACPPIARVRSRFRPLVGVRERQRERASSRRERAECFRPQQDC